MPHLDPILIHDKISKKGYPLRVFEVCYKGKSNVHILVLLDIS